MWRFGILAVLLVLGNAYPLEENENENGEKKGSDLPMLNAGFFEGDMAGVNPWNRNAMTNYNQRWSNGVIPFVIDGSLSGITNMIYQAMQHYHQYTCIRFQQRTYERDYIVLQKGQGCWSYVGRQGGAQVVSLGSGCEYLGTVIHELLHAVGFWHEQNRPDRDNWLTIYWNNIQRGQENNFRKMGTNEVTTLNEQYDYRSIMHYGEYSFAIDSRSPTMVAKVQGVRIGEVWEKNSLSASDLRRIKKLYQC